MHNGFRHLRYAVQWIEPVVARHPKATQRAAADEIARKIGADWRLWSRSHSRGTVVAAAGNPPLTRLGVDVEYADPRRPWRNIAAIYLPEYRSESQIDVSTLCRLWTFGEAHFKAFGSVPDAELLRRIMQAPPPEDEPVMFGPRRYWYSEPLPDNFWLTLVWEEEI
jgi:phosphopantetheinyl transferase